MSPSLVTCFASTNFSATDVVVFSFYHGQRRVTGRARVQEIFLRCAITTFNSRFLTPCPSLFTVICPSIFLSLLSLQLSRQSINCNVASTQSVEHVPINRLFQLLATLIFLLTAP
jgi:hypothetical protein